MTSFRFQNIDKDILKKKDPNITVVNAFNSRIDNIFSDVLIRQNLDQKIAKLKAESRIPNPNKMTLSQFIVGLQVDIFDTYNELMSINILSISKINRILDKNYRRLTILVILFCILFIIYHILSIKSYLFSDARKT